MVSKTRSFEVWGLRLLFTLAMVAYMTPLVAAQVCSANEECCYNEGYNSCGCCCPASEGCNCDVCNQYYDNGSPYNIWGSIWIWFLFVLLLFACCGGGYRYRRRIYRTRYVVTEPLYYADADAMGYTASPNGYQQYPQDYNYQQFNNGAVPGYPVNQQQQSGGLAAPGQVAPVTAYPARPIGQ